MSISGGLRLATVAAVALLAALVVVLTLRDGAASAQVDPAAPGNTIFVTTAEDVPVDEACTLRGAIRAANRNEAVGACTPGSATERDGIRFDLGPEATIVLGNTLPPIADPAGLDIIGGPGRISVSGNQQVRVFNVKQNAKFSLRRITVENAFVDQTGVGTGNGGGIRNDGGIVTVSRSTFSGNDAANLGGGIANLNGGTLTVTNSTFFANRAFVGGGIVNDGTLRVSYSTFSGNQAEQVGGAINTANARGARATLSSTIFANSAGGNVFLACGGAAPCRGEIVDGGYNISDDESYRFPARTSRINTNPRFATVTPDDNGGLTDTIALQADSPAVDDIPDGTNGCGDPVQTDQRGVARPQGPGCDVGSFERELPN